MHRAGHEGRVRLREVSSFQESSGSLPTVLRAGGTLELLDAHGEVLQRLVLRAGDSLLVGDGEQVKSGATLVVSNDWTDSVFADLPAAVRATFRFCTPALVEEHLDEVTGLWFFCLRAAIEPVPFALDAAGAVQQTGWARAGDRIHVKEGAEVGRGDLLLSRPRAQRLSPQPGGGLQRLRELLDAPQAPWPLHPAQLAVHAGVVRLSEDRRGCHGTIVGESGAIQHFRAATSSQLVVSEGDEVVPGDALTDGSRCHRELLHILGPEVFAAHLAEELELVFALDQPAPDTRALDLLAREQVAASDPVAPRRPGGGK